MAAASVCLPFSINEDDSLLDCLDNWDGPLTKIITPNCNIGLLCALKTKENYLNSIFLGGDRAMQLFTLRGVAETLLKKSKHRDLPAYKCDSIKDMLMYFLSCSTYASANQTVTVEEPMKVGKCFPEIFDNRIGRNGFVVHERSNSIGEDFLKTFYNYYYYYF